MSELLQLNPLVHLDGHFHQWSPKAKPIIELGSTTFQETGDLKSAQMGGVQMRLAFDGFKSTLFRL